MRLPIVVLSLFVVVPLAASEVPSPAGPGSAYPFLASFDGKLLMTWTEKVGEEHAVKFASYRDGKWTRPTVVVQRRDLFVNWADFPSITTTDDGTLFVHFLQKSGEGTYAYDVHLSTSSDGGRTWSRSRVIHNDGVQAEHGFVSMMPVRGDAVGIVWLDGREMKGHHGGDMTLRYARIDSRGRFARQDLLDSRVCECCSTGMAMASDGPVVVYRDRSEKEIRDISVVRWSDGRWLRPVPLHTDGWKIEGCPVNGPQIAARGDHVAVAWFTAGQQDERVLAAFSKDSGATFSAPVRIDRGKAIGRVDVALLDDGTAVAVWIDGEHVVARRISERGAGREIVNVVPASAARGAGFPRIAVHEGKVFVAMTDPQAKTIRLRKIF